MSRFTVLEKQAIMLHLSIANFGCSAETPSDLLSDNYSWANFNDFANKFGKAKAKGILGSLIKKGVIGIEKREDIKTGVFGQKLPKKMWQKMADLYWITEEFLETLDQDTKFADLDL